MSDVDEVLERLVTDQAFRTQLRGDPVAALGGYDLEDADLAVLAATLDEGQRSDHGVEQRTSKSAFLTAIMGLSGAGSGGHGAHPDLFAPDDAERDPATRSQCVNNLKQLGVGLHDADPIQDLAIDDGPEEAVQITYPGVYVQETPSPETGAAPPDAEVASGDADLEAPAEADQGPSDIVAADEPEGTTIPEGPQTEPPDLVAERRTEEAETVHAFLKANGTDLQGESRLPPDPDHALDDAAGQRDADL